MLHTLVSCLPYVTEYGKSITIPSYGIINVSMVTKINFFFCIFVFLCQISLQ